MPLLFLIFALVSLVGVGCLLLSLVVGAWLLRTRPSSPIGIFVLIVPTLSAVSALATSWGLAFLVDSLSKSAASTDAWQRWQVLALWGLAYRVCCRWCHWRRNRNPNRRIRQQTQTRQGPCQRAR